MVQIIVIAFFLILNLSFWWWFKKQRPQSVNSSSDSFRAEMRALRQELQASLELNTQQVHQQIERSNHLIGNFSQELGAVKELGVSVKDLHSFMQKPKLRGQVGEQLLHDLLAQFFAQQNYQLQYRFQTGVIVDAIVRVNQGMIPIDAKFPVDNFQGLVEADSTTRPGLLKDFERDLKRHINNVADKYILPSEGTFDLAVLYIPAEAIYYQIMVEHPQLTDLAAQRKVVLVAPNMFVHFIRLLLVAHQGAEVEETAQQIIKLLASLQQDSQNFAKELSVLTNHLNNSKNTLDRVNGQYQRLNNRLAVVSNLKGV